VISAGRQIVGSELAEQFKAGLKVLDDVIEQ
jgi:hypothetical protein